MDTRLRDLLIAVCLLALTLMGFGQGIAAHEMGQSPIIREDFGLPGLKDTEVLALVDLAKSDLMDREEISADGIVLQSIKAVQFPDTSLGILEPGKRYLQTATPGYVIRLGTDKAAYEYRSSGRRIVLVPSEAKAYKAAQRLIRMSISDVQDQLDVPLDEVMVQSIEPTEFPDASLGAPEPNKPYALVVTLGHNIRLLVKGVVYRYWAANGRVVYVGSFVEPPGATGTPFGTERNR